MLGFLALLVFLGGNLALLVARVGVLDTRSLPQYLVCGAASILAIAHFVRVGSRARSRAGTIAACATIGLSIVLLSAIEILTHYDADRPKGPEIANVFPVERLQDAVNGEPILLAPAPGDSAAGE